MSAFWRGFWSVWWHPAMYWLWMGVCIIWGLYMIYAKSDALSTTLGVIDLSIGMLGVGSRIAVRIATGRW